MSIYLVSAGGKIFSTRTTTQNNGKIKKTHLIGLKEFDDACEAGNETACEELSAMMEEVEEDFREDREEREDKEDCEEHEEESEEDESEEDESDDDESDEELE